jgi:pilus assembly protein CpaB
MKWGVLILVVLGVVAALSAALLISGSPLNRRAGLKVSPEDDVVLAVKSVPAMSVITSSDITKGKGLRKTLPEGYLSSPVQAIGKVLDVPVVEGQVLTKSLFVSDGTGAQLAAAIPEGMRAVSITLSNTSNRGGLLYAGCVVDILASFKLGQGEGGQAISTTLLRGIQVLAVEGTSVVSKDAEEKAPGQIERTASRDLTVILMVDPKQAEALQVAKEYGTISLAMRNPLDKSPVDVDATVLSQGRLAKFGSALDPAVFAARNKKGQPPDINDLSAQTKSTAQQETSGKGALPEGKPSWPVTVIRGREVKQQELDIREITTAPRAGT